MQKKQKQKTLLISLISILLFSVVLAIVYYPAKDNYKQENESDITVVDKEAEELKNQNKDILKTASEKKTLKVREIDNNDHLWGNPDAPVQYIVYADFRCKFCAAYIDTLKKVREEYPDDVVIAFRHYYLRNRSESIKAAMVAECAAEQGKFWEMYEELYVNRIDFVVPDNYFDTASELALDVDKFNTCINEERYAKKIRDDMTEALEFGVLGTPSSFINGQKITGDYAFEDFRDSSGRDREGVRSIIEKHLQND